MIPIWSLRAMESRSVFAESCRGNRRQRSPVDAQADTPAFGPVPGGGSVRRDAGRLWSEGVDGAGVTVAVIDTGVTPVADLAGRVIGGVDFSGENDPFTDSFGHGTFVAGIIAGDGTSSGGAYTGVAPKADIVSV